MRDDQDLLFELTTTAVDLVMKEQRPLFKYKEQLRRGVERSFAFRTGIYLNKALASSKWADFDLDSEYNKVGIGLKSTQSFQNGIQPDLILHQRDSNDNNVLVVEFKGVWTGKNSAGKDVTKLEELTLQNGDFRYKLGLLVAIGGHDVGYRKFIDGKEVKL